MHCKGQKQRHRVPSREHHRLSFSVSLGRKCKGRRISTIRQDLCCGAMSCLRQMFAVLVGALSFAYVYVRSSTAYSRVTKTTAYSKARSPFVCCHDLRQGRCHRSGITFQRLRLRMFVKPSNVLYSRLHTSQAWTHCKYTSLRLFHCCTAADQSTSSLSGTGSREEYNPRRFASTLNRLQYQQNDET